MNYSSMNFDLLLVNNGQCFKIVCIFYITLRCLWNVNYISMAHVSLPVAPMRVVGRPIFAPAHKKCLLSRNKGPVQQASKKSLPFLPHVTKSRFCFRKKKQ